MKPPLKILDGFAGIGGFSYAAHKIVGGFETTQFIEIDKFCQKLLAKRFPNIPIHDDVRTFTANLGEFDVFCSGFPCQDISVAGLQKGITKETRSGLFFEVIRIIRMVRPKFVVLENVAAILNNGLDIVLGELSEAGYDAEWAIVSCEDMGGCHRRQRWWCVAYPKGKFCDGDESQSTFNKESSTSKSRNSDIKSSNSNSKGMERRVMEVVHELQIPSHSWKTDSYSGKESTDTDNNGLSSTEKCGINEETGNGTSQGQDSVSQSERSSESTGSGSFQSVSDTTDSNDPRYHRPSKLQVDSQRQKAIQQRKIPQLEPTRQADITNSNGTRTQSNCSKKYKSIWANAFINSSQRRTLGRDWTRYVSEPCLRRGDDGLRGRMDRLKSLGNSVSPPVAAIPLQRVHDLYYK